MEIAAIIISSLALLAIIVAIVLIVRKPNNTQTSQVDLKEIGMLQQQLNSLTDQLKTNIKLSVRWSNPKRVTNLTMKS